MGIRIHKCIGYALLNVKYKKYNIIDDRFNEPNILNDYELLEEKMNIDSYSNWLTEQITEENRIDISFCNPKMWWEKCDEKEKRKKKNHFENSVFWDSEFGDGNVLLIMDPNSPDWERYDDIIDYIEECELSRNNVKKLSHGIYPHIIGYYDKKHDKIYDNGEIILRKLFAFIHEIENYSKRTKKYKELIPHINDILYSIDFDDIEDFKENVIPKTPKSIEMLCKYLNLFKDEKTIELLRPIVYSYWM